MLKLHAVAGGIRLDSLFDAAPPQFKRLAIQSCCSDSRNVRPGDLFVAIVGADHDGHEFIYDAIKRGAVGVIAERPFPDRDVPVCVVADSRIAHGQLCQALAGWPATELKTVGVTGTNGKSTTAALIASVLNMAGGRTGVLSTLGYTDGQSCAPAPRTTPSAPLLAKWLGQMVATYCTHAAIEVSSDALARQSLAGVELDVACITNITRAHLNRHNTLDNYRRAKSRILDLLSASGVAVLNADDPNSMRLMSELSCPALTVGIDQPAEITGTIIGRTLCDQTFLIHIGDETAAVRTRMVGDHHVYNCLQAAAVGIANGIDLTTIARGLEALDSLAGRMERIDLGQDFAVFVDDARTPQALAASLTALRHVTPGRIHCVFGSDGGEDRESRLLLARAAAKLADNAIITTTKPYNEPPAWIAAEVSDGFEATEEFTTILDRRDAIEHAFANAAPDDTVLIAGRGGESFQHIGAAPSSTDDREIARALLLDGDCENSIVPWRTAA